MRWACCHRHPATLFDPWRDQVLVHRKVVMCGEFFGRFNFTAIDATKLIAHKTWLYRVLGEDSNNYLLQVARNAENGVDWPANGWKPLGMSYLKWIHALAHGAQ